MEECYFTFRRRREKSFTVVVGTYKDLIFHFFKTMEVIRFINVERFYVFSSNFELWNIEV